MYPYSIPQWIQVNSPTFPSETSNLPINDEKNTFSNIIACELIPAIPDTLLTQYMCLPVDS